MCQDLLDLGDATFRKRRYAEAAAIYERAVEAARSEGQRESTVEGLSQVARCHLVQGEAESGRPWLERAARLASPEEASGWSRYLGVRGRFEWKARELATASATFQEMYAFCMAQGLHERAIDAAHMVAIVEPTEAQVAWAKKGIEAAEAGGQESWLGPLWNNLGWTYDELDQRAEALAAFERAREYHHRSQDDQRKLVADWAVARAHRRMGDLASARAWQRATFEWAEERHSAAPDDASAEWLGMAHWELAELDLADGLAERAADHLAQARSLLAASGAIEHWRDQLSELESRVAAPVQP